MKRERLEELSEGNGYEPLTSKLEQIESDIGYLRDELNDSEELADIAGELLMMREAFGALVHHRVRTYSTEAAREEADEKVEALVDAFYEVYPEQ